MTKRIHTIITLSLAGVLSAGLYAGNAASDQSQGSGSNNTASQSAGNVQQQLSEIEAEYVQVATKIKDIEQEAVRNKTVEHAKDAFESRLEDRMLELNPELENKLVERKKYSRYIDKIQAGEAPPENVDVNEVYTRYNTIQQEIIPVRQKAIEHDTVREAFDKFQGLLVSRMQEIDPQVDEYLRLRKELVAEYQSLMGQTKGQGG